MTVTDIEEKIEQLRATLGDEPSAYDADRARLAEQAIWEQVLLVIAETKGITGFEARELARAALKTQEVEYERWS